MDHFDGLSALEADPVREEHCIYTLHGTSNGKSEIAFCVVFKAKDQGSEVQLKLSLGLE
jgi:hypothetical protein